MSALRLNSAAPCSFQWTDFFVCICEELELLCKLWKARVNEFKSSFPSNNVITVIWWAAHTENQLVREINECCLLNTAALSMQEQKGRLGKVLGQGPGRGLSDAHRAQSTQTSSPWPKGLHWASPPIWASVVLGPSMPQQEALLLALQEGLPQGVDSNSSASSGCCLSLGWEHWGRAVACSCLGIVCASLCPSASSLFFICACHAICVAHPSVPSRWKICALSFYSLFFPS